LIFTKNCALEGEENPGSARRKACTWCQRKRGFFCIYDRARIYCSTTPVQEFSETKKGRASSFTANISGAVYEFFVYMMAAGGWRLAAGGWRLAACWRPCGSPLQKAKQLGVQNSHAERRNRRVFIYSHADAQGKKRE